MRQLVHILFAFVFASLASAQNYDSGSWAYAQPVAGATSGVVLLECPFLEHPEYASDATCVETHVPSHEVRAGIDQVLDPLIERAVEGHTEQFATRLRTGWNQMEGGYLMRGWPLKADTSGPWLRVELHDLGDSRLITLYALH